MPSTVVRVVRMDDTGMIDRVQLPAEPQVGDEVVLDDEANNLAGRFVVRRRLLGVGPHLVVAVRPPLDDYPAELALTALTDFGGGEQ